MAKSNVTVIIPALNEEKAIGRVLEEIPKDHVNRVLVVDNGSTDRTPEVAKMLGAKVLFEPRRGYGRSVLKGIKQLTLECDTVVILDGDHSDYPEDLPDLLQPLEKGEADLVIGSRTQKALPGSLTLQQRFGNWLTCCLIGFFYGCRLSDMGPFRAIRRSTLDALKMRDKNFGWNVEMQIKALRHGFKVAEVPVRYRPRIGESKISGTIKGTVHAGVVILWSVFKYGMGKKLS